MLTLGHYRGDSVSNPMIITVFDLYLTRSSQKGPNELKAATNLLQNILRESDIFFAEVSNIILKPRKNRDLNKIPFSFQLFLLE